jgi:hypothetical protein
MPRGNKSTSAQNRKRQADAVEKGHKPQGEARPDGQGRTWASVSKPPGGVKNIGSRRKVPSGPIGGSGRKTNLARSS